MRIGLLVITVALFTGAVDAHGGDIRERHPYMVVLDSSGAPIRMSDEQFYKMAREVRFKVNKYQVENADSLRRDLMSKILPYMRSQDLRLVAARILGGASIEGPEAWNRTLALRRAQALRQLLEQGTGEQLDSLLTMDSVAEDYDYLLLTMSYLGDPDTHLVREAVRANAGQSAALKRFLQTANQGKLWRKMLDIYFPKMRVARMVLFFAPVEKKTAPVVPIPEVTEQMSQVEVPVVTVPQPAAPAPQPTNEAQPRRPLLSVQTNLLMDFAYVPGYDRFCPIPNIAVEYYPKRGHFTFLGSFDNPWWQDYDDHKYFQIRNYQLETRYYLRSSTGRVGKAPFRGWYASLYAHAGIYGISFSARRAWVGEGAGAGIGIGYVAPLGRHGRWRLAFGAQVGAFVTKYDPFQYESPLYPDLHDNLYYYKWYNWGTYFKKRQYRFTWLGPTRVGITLSYDLLYRRQNKKGASFKYWEKSP